MEKFKLLNQLKLLFLLLILLLIIINLSNNDNRLYRQYFSSNYIAPTKMADNELMNVSMLNGNERNFNALSFYISLLGQIKFNLDALHSNIEQLSHLSTNERNYLFDWYRLTYSLVNRLSKFNSQERQFRQNLLTGLIFKKIDLLQNPADCTAVKKLRCKTEKPCGFGCTIHHIVHCLIAALALNRTVIFSSTENILFKPFKPIQSACLNETIQSINIYDSIINNKTLYSSDVLELPYIDNLSFNVHFRPLAIPMELNVQLQELTRVPFILFAGNIVSYIMRLNDYYNKMFNEYKQNQGFTNDEDNLIVGVHVRRTDKLLFEANYYSFDKYMIKVKDYYDRIDVQDCLNGRNNKRIRKVYLATDDPLIWINDVPKFVKQGYQFYGNISITRSANPKLRSLNQSRDGFILDVFSLSFTDYLVCTLSSQVCRIAYELMQVQKANGRDMVDNIYSLDNYYYFGGQVRNFNFILF